MLKAWRIQDCLSSLENRVLFLFCVVMCGFMHGGQLDRGILIQNQVGLSDCESMWFGLRQKKRDDIFSKVRVSPEVTELKNSLKD